MPSIFITGTNRGLGLEWVRQYAQEGWRVYASCRHPAEAEALKALAHKHSSVSIHRLDVTKADDMRAIIWEMEGKPIDLLVCNAGVYLEKGRPEFGCLRYAEWGMTFEVNTKGTVRVIEALVGNVEQSEKKLVVAISSHMGSIAVSRVRAATTTGRARLRSMRSCKGYRSSCRIGVSASSSSIPAG